MQSLYSAASGLSSQQKRLETLASNIANASTPGFKSTRTDFKDALYTTMDNPVQADSMQSNLLRGSGVLLDSTSIDFRQGIIVQTENLLDFAISGEGFFSVQNQEGDTLYTRSGVFNISEYNGNVYLVTAQGHFVLDSEGNRITVDTSSRLSVTEDGSLTTADGNTVVMGLYRFTNPQGLIAEGGVFRPSETSGAPEPDTDSKIIQGSLENSNVDLAQELTMLIRAQRSYSLASRALTTSDDMLGLANNMR
jgi:flagellar basal-body rod protein FlgG